MIMAKIKALFSKTKLYSVRSEAMEADYPRPGKNESPPFIGKWAVLSYFVPSGLMHSEDQDRYLNEKRSGEDLFECIEEENQWVKLRNNENEEYRVNPSRVLWVPRPEFDLRDEVETTNGTRRVGWICTRVWHFKQKRFYYYIEIENKNGEIVKHKRRYWSEDLLRKNG